MTARKYGWKRDLPDFRDLHCSLVDGVMGYVWPSSVDLRKTGFMPAIYDQGQLGSCTGNGIAGAIEYDMAAQKLNVWQPSRLWIYYYERVLEGTVDTDSGAAIRDGFKVINTNGYCSEATWPYDITQFTVEPNAEAKKEAKNDRVIKYQRVDQTFNALKGILTHGHPIVFGISVYESFESDSVASNGVVPMPSANEQLLGGHCIVLVGYNDSKQLFTFRNSWGTSWGDAGYGYLPYSYVINANLASDFWIVLNEVDK